MKALIAVLVLLLVAMIGIAVMYGIEESEARDQQTGTVIEIDRSKPRPPMKSQPKKR